ARGLASAPRRPFRAGSPPRRTAVRGRGRRPDQRPTRRPADPPTRRLRRHAHRISPRARVPRAPTLERHRPHRPSHDTRGNHCCRPLALGLARRRRRV
ncbi:MAG: hypothetical protein AVDCRST_MAG49-3058, partial [uncultured Thermomicrobiales bacterium]